nr:Flp family type IVb pilin [Rhodospirillales bacterium]
MHIVKAKNQQGSVHLEYALVAILISIIVLTLLTSMGQTVNNLFGNAALQSAFK